MTLPAIIADSPDIGKGLEVILKSMGVESVTAFDGENSLSCSSPLMTRT
jgi:hypothetical protein